MTHLVSPTCAKYDNLLLSYQLVVVILQRAGGVLGELGFELGDARSANRVLERAASSRWARARLSAVSWRTRCLRVVFSVVIRWTASSVSSRSASRIWPRSCPMWSRWARISAWAALRASSAFSARSRHEASAWESCSD